MDNQKCFTDTTAADDTSIGFDYQYYYFLYRLLNLKTGQSVGLEVKDDVHSDLDADIQLLFQLKHTVQKSATGSAIALSELDSDLWKTLHNWAKVISDSIDKRATVMKQLSFVKRTEFHLVTNKSESKSNRFLKLIRALQEQEVNFDEIKKHAKSLHSKTTDSKIKKFISAVLNLSDEVFEEFARRIFIQLNEDNNIGLVKVSASGTAGYSARCGFG